LIGVTSTRVGTIVKVGVIAGVMVNVGNIACVGTGLKNSCVGGVDVQPLINNKNANLKTCWPKEILFMGHLTLEINL
jgi:hypothetical protein